MTDKVLKFGHSLKNYFLYPVLPNASPFPVWQSWRKLSMYLPQLKQHPA